MKFRTHLIPIFLVGVVGLSTGGVAQAQARGAAARNRGETTQQEKQGLDDAARAREVKALDSWLRRLVGRFRVTGSVSQIYNDGMLTSRAAKGIIDCAAIGQGAGIHCIINVSWHPIYSIPFGQAPALPEFSEHYNTMQPAVMVLGLNEEDPGIQFQLVDDLGVAESGLARLIDTKLIFRTAYEVCGPPFHCPRSMRITSDPRGKVIWMEMTWNAYDTRFIFALHREAAGK